MPRPGALKGKSPLIFPKSNGGKVTGVPVIALTASGVPTLPLLTQHPEFQGI